MMLMSAQNKRLHHVAHLVSEDLLITLIKRVYFQGIPGSLILMY